MKENLKIKLRYLRKISKSKTFLIPWFQKIIKNLKLEENVNDPSEKDKSNEKNSMDQKPDNNNDKKDGKNKEKQEMSIDAGIPDLEHSSHEMDTDGDQEV